MLFCFSLAVVMSALFVGGGSAGLIRECHLHGVPWTEFVDLTWTFFYDTFLKRVFFCPAMTLCS